MTAATEEIGGSITLSAHLPIKEDQQESPAKGTILMGKSQSAHSCPLPINEETDLFGADERAMGKNGQNETCPLESPILQVKSGNGQVGNGDDTKGETELGSYEYLND